jgi:hypothetical protein
VIKATVRITRRRTKAVPIRPPYRCTSRCGSCWFVVCGG